MMRPRIAFYTLVTPHQLIMVLMRVYRFLMVRERERGSSSYATMRLYTHNEPVEKVSAEDAS
jgi:hypothetical protein